MKITNKEKSNKDMIETRIKSDREAIQYCIDNIKDNSLLKLKECGIFTRLAKINKKINKFRLKSKMLKNYFLNILMKIRT